VTEDGIANLAGDDNKTGIVWNNRFAEPALASASASALADR
jgi:hypothetical protein